MPAEKYIKAGDTAPNLHPLPATSRAVESHAVPREVWREWYTLPKTPLLVRASGENLTSPHELDALLGPAVRRWVAAPWHLEDEQGQVLPRVIPLPLALLGIVPGPERRNAARLPVWASTSLTAAPDGGLMALCIGHAETLRQILTKLPDIDGQRVEWTVSELPIREEEALERIRLARPMPGQAERFTPPYWYDWMAPDA